MPILLWDSSALVKRYAPEVGTDTVDALFQTVPASSMVVTLIGYAETCSILLRKRNRGAIGPQTYTTARSSLRLEVIEDPGFGVLSVDDRAVLDGIELMERHNLNAFDAALLAKFLRFARAQLVDGDRSILVTADQRLNRAAQREGLATLDPERAGPAEATATV